MSETGRSQASPTNIISWHGFLHILCPSTSDSETNTCSINSLGPYFLYNCYSVMWFWSNAENCLEAHLSGR